MFPRKSSQHGRSLIRQGLDWLTRREAGRSNHEPLSATLGSQSPLSQAGPEVATLTHNGLTWVYLERPAISQIQWLASHFSTFHPLSLEDVLSRVQRPKIDEYPDHLFIIMHFPVFDKVLQVTVPSEVDFFVGKDYVVTAHCSGDLKPLAKLFWDCQHSEEVKAQVMSRGSAYLFYQMLDKLVDYCFPILDKIMDNTESLESEIFASPQLGTVQRLSGLRRDLIAFRRIIHPQIAVIENLEHQPRPLFRGEQEIYFGDIADHIRRIWDGLEDTKEVLEALIDTTNWIVSHRIQERMRVLTLVTIIMATLMVITGFYGMNIYLPFGAQPPGNPSHWIGFVVLVGVMVTITVGLVYYFRRKHWI